MCTHTLCTLTVRQLACKQSVKGMRASWYALHQVDDEGLKNQRKATQSRSWILQPRTPYQDSGSKSDYTMRMLPTAIFVPPCFVAPSASSSTITARSHQCSQAADATSSGTCLLNGSWQACHTDTRGSPGSMVDSVPVCTTSDQTNVRMPDKFQCFTSRHTPRGLDTATFTTITRLRSPAPFPCCA